ncbi:protein-L-isoaspartate O-methyltransferase [Pelomonas sp. SE-A7]|uniref:protein-L-isoaspartate O-methyltransferase family protein n=1 Tax=Pelomonas sp. SE-A7 TaxID=3054953 RepID=UPI00259CAC6E|nr:protein-L-isoaspartate O-methyltransferase [Pelomonas sp. SE-A7]MDM4764796.1 protein-L-isoaspartate O-methyltransferase [Pelomonas sp. SE-A7]
MDIEQARFNMIEQQIRPWDVLDAGVLALLGQVKREDFVPEAQRALAFMDTELPLGGGRQTLAPRVEARLVQELRVSRQDKVLEIGTGSGYVAALLGHQARQVVTLEQDPTLAARATKSLKKAGLNNVVVRESDGNQGLAGEAPFDAILLSGSVQEIPQALLDQLKAGGRLIAIVGSGPVMQATRYERQADGQVSRRELFDTVAPRLAGFTDKPAFQF